MVMLTLDYFYHSPEYALAVQALTKKVDTTIIERMLKRNFYVARRTYLVRRRKIQSRRK